jgi:serine/threonine protein kinase
VDKNKSINNDLKSNGQLRQAFAVNNSNQQCIINNIETMDVAKLSPRSKEVYLIRQLIVDCFQRYGKPPKTQLELYKIGKMLGKGAFGKVNLGLHRLTRKLVAIKSINMDFMKEES